MKVLAIYGSPHEDGGSTRVVREVVRGAKVYTKYDIK